MSTPTIIATENLAEEMESWGLHHATYWSRNPSSWGCLSDWDVQFIEETPGCTRDESHRNLGIELNILLNKFPSTSRQYSKANALKKALGNSDGDSANILLWEKHLEELKSIAISDRVHRRTIKSITIQEEIGRAEEQISEKSKKHKASTKECEISSSSSSSKNDENYNKQEDDDAIISGNDLREASESMVGKVRTPLTVNNIGLDLVGFLSSNQCLRSEKANDEPPKTPEHQIYQKQGDYSKPFASCEEQSHGIHSSEISQNLGDSIESNDHDSDEDEFGLKDMNLFKQSIGQLEEMEIEVGKIFSEEELSEIVEKKKEQSIPEIDEEILEYIDTFAKEEIMTHILILFMTTVTDWVRILEMEPNPLTMDMPEAWHRINVWRTIDIMFSDTPYVYVVGGEKAGLACSERKNRYRTLANIGPTQRKKIGKKGDAYVRTIGSTSTDWAGSEAGHKWDGPHGTKLMKESGLSLPRTLKDIFVHLAGKIDFEEQKMRKLNIIGFIHAGAVLMRVSLDCPAGYICRYTRRNLLEVYADVNNFGRSLDVLVEIIHAKFLILQTMKIVNDLDDNSNVSRWKQQIKSNSKRSLDMPDVHPTPKKQRNAKTK
ncbi:19235_t:CDS:10, partial [Funneliformis geosporum]